jgi:hypothetical protein
MKIGSYVAFEMLNVYSLLKRRELKLAFPFSSKKKRATFQL